MKKLKIFLLLSILLCLGFTLTSEVHAQGGGPKAFEVNDVLPATTQLKISWVSFKSTYMENVFVSTSSGFDLIYEWEDNNFCLNVNNQDVYMNKTTYPGGNVIIDTSSWSEAKRTIAYVDSLVFTWEDLNVPTGYTITFNSNGGTNISDIEGVTELPTPLPIPTKENHTFLGWYYNSTFTQIANAGDTIESNVTLYAKWELNAYKPFEVGDELPAGYIKISWDFTDKPLSDGDTFSISGDYLDIEINQFDLPYNGYYIELDINGEKFIGDTPGYTIITLTEPSTIHSFGGPIGRLEDYYEYIDGAIFWEALPPEYLGGYDNVYDGEQLEIEEGYILPEAKIGINLLFNNTGGNKSGTVVFTFSDSEYEYGQIIFTAQEDNLGRRVTSAEINVQPNPSPRGWDIYTIDDTLANQTFGSTRGILFAGILLDFRWLPTEARTITDITIEGDLELDIICTRILTEEEIAYQEGFSNGYQAAREIFGWKDGDDWYNGIDAWNLGEKYARELYGFYDSTTDEWLTVSEYVARYGTGNGNGNGNGSSGASDFYNNFDKYFIPAMIIVFGGAIVLTILKVFKGRE